jgi:acyl-CoA synthetase (AMP-forming)/AMP-acid ligase II
MRGQMMQQPLLISSLLQHAERCHGDVAIVSRRVEPAEGEARFHRYDWQRLAARTRQLANALARLGVSADDRVGTLAWNGYRHMELYYAVSCSGAITHTINPRLFLEQIAWIINHAEDRVIFFDLDLAPLVEKLLPLCASVQHWVLMSDEAAKPSTSIPDLKVYETLLQAESDVFAWPLFDENQAANLCYTSGTTGNPKGALYSHRSIVLHSYAAALPDVMNLSSRDVALPIVPMFHVNAWSIPYTAALVGFKLVFPGPMLDGASLSELFAKEAVSFSAGVPTVWLGLLNYAREHGVRLPALRRCLVGGSALPRSLMEAFEAELGVRLQPSWGMTEMSPLGAVNSMKPKHEALPVAERQRFELKAGRIPFGVAAKIVDDNGDELPRDGVTPGALMVRGPWIIDSYFKAEASPLVDGWLPTGDVATLDGDGYIDITDRAKDLIKSGGEWISSIELENIAMSHPAVAEAAVIAAAHPKWDERPLLVVVRRRAEAVTREQLLAHYSGRIAKWWVPDDVVFVDELPHTATGKVQKLKLRQQFAGYALPGTA